MKTEQIPDRGTYRQSTDKREAFLFRQAPNLSGVVARTGMRVRIGIVTINGLLTLHTAAAARQPQGTGHRLSIQVHKPSGVVLKEVGAPACRIKVASSANALTPWLKDLDASTWAQDPNTRRQTLS